MIARVSIVLPFHLWIPEGSRLSSVEIVWAPYRVVINTPGQLVPAGRENAPIDAVRVGDRLVARSVLEFSDRVKVRPEGSAEARRTAAVDLFQVDIHAPEFDRSEEQAWDTSKKLAHVALSTLIDRVVRPLRLLTRSSVLTLGELTRWGLEYLDDNCGELTKEAGKIRRFGGFAGDFTVTVLTESIWHKTRSPVPEARWRELLLDAERLRTHRGPALVLAATAIETLIDTVLDHVAAKASLPSGLWEWITERGDVYSKVPSFAERCGDLLGFLSGKSLKDETKFWKAFTEIKRARDRFVHEGVLILAEAAVFALLRSAAEIVDYLEGFLPVELRTPTSENVEVGVNLEVINLSDAQITVRAGLQSALRPTRA